MLDQIIAKELVSRIYRDVVFEDDIECYQWIASHTIKDSLPYFKYKQKTLYPMKILFLAKYGKYPKRLYRICKTLSCVNPEHCSEKAPLKSSILEKLRKGGEVDLKTKCYNWKKSKDRDGYGQIHHNGKLVYVHRISYELCYCRIPDGLVVRHKCDNPGCFNPDHLELGTKRENSQDMVKRNRATGSKTKGEKHGNAKLTDNQIARILIETKNGRRTSELAKENNCEYSYIRSIIRNEKREFSKSKIILYDIRKKKNKINAKVLDRENLS